MLRNALIVLFIIIYNLSIAQTPQVPSSMEFGGIELKLDKNAQELIQASVNSLTRHPKSFQIMVDRANIYFPIIERVLASEGVPEDLKYLVLQESALVPNAVSSSNAVGYWQFKKEAAFDVNMLVNGDVDERMHIVSATRGAAKYIKKNNQYLSNWLNALLSYYTGLGGVRLLVKPEDANADKMKIEGTTHVYVLKFLSHKIAFENELRKASPAFALLEYRDCKNKTLKEIADELEVGEEELAHYNQWLKSRKVPENRDYSVIVPASKDNYSRLAALTGDDQNFYAAKESPAQPKAVSVGKETFATKTLTKNGLKAIIAGNNETLESLSKKGKISRKRFVKYNELEKDQKITPGQLYYLQAKRNRAEKEFHTAELEETYWSISQLYGVKKSRLLRFNRIGRNEKLQHGRVLWLSETRPSIIPVEIKISQKTVASAPKKEVQVITYPDNKKVSEEKTITKVETTDEFPDDFYEAPKPAVKSENIPSPSTPKEASLIDTKALYPETVVPAKKESSETETIHEVSKGETLYSISKQYAVSIDELREMNNLTENALKIGQRLVIKKGNVVKSVEETAKTGNYITYKVQTGDSIYKIAKMYNVTIQQLQQWNNKSDYNIFIGEELKIYSN